MIERNFTRRGLVATATVALLAGCTVIPKAPPEQPRPEQPSANVLPTDSGRHRVALLLPMGGANMLVSESIANAANMALLDTNAQNIRITTYDTSDGPAAAANKAIADGNKLILGPLDASEVAPVAAIARAARVPVISYTGDASVAGAGVYVMGMVPDATIARTVSYARGAGASRFALLKPDGDYGQRASAAYSAAVTAAGGRLVATENYDRANTSAASAARRLASRGGYDAVLIADGARIATLAAPQLKPKASAGPRILGTELWNGEGSIATSSALRGAWYASVSDAMFRQFADSYKSRFGGQPFRVATLGYDSVLLTIRVARNWKPGTAFPVATLADKGGFIGLDGPLRFASNGVIERALEVREVRAGTTATVSPAPEVFAD